MQTKAAERLVKDAQFFAENVLQILPKSGGNPIPFRLNRAQNYLHEQLEKQKKLTGRVRALVLKGRQQGISTYVGARYYHGTVTQPGTLTAIFAHDSSASDSLYQMVANYYDLSPKPMQPTLGSRNAKELLFPTLRSGYKVGTAGTAGLGRGKTLHRVHWSEVAYSPNPDDHAAGILQAVPDTPGTEVILESTANGEGDYFHRSCMAAMAGQSDYILVFLPWYWQDEYKREIDGEFTPEEDEAEYMRLFETDGLTLEHLNWRRFKIREFGNDISRFKHEYPFTPEEAFEASDAESYIKAALVRSARNTQAQHTSAPLIVGVDPAAFGGDRFVVAMRKGRNLTKITILPPDYPHAQAQRIAQIIQEYRPQRVNIDAGGLGIGVIGSLKDLGHGDIVSKVDFGGKALDSEKYYNRTAEMFARCREWLEDAPVSINCDEKMASAIQTELSGRRHTWHHNSQLRMESKADYKKRLTLSPDIGDAVLLTFAEVVAETMQHFGRRMQPVQANVDGWNPFG